MIKVNNIIQASEKGKSGTILEIDHVKGNKIGSFIAYKQNLEGDVKIGYFKTISVTLSCDQVISCGYYNKLDEEFSIEDVDEILRNSDMYLVTDESEIKKVREQSLYI